MLAVTELSVSLKRIGTASYDVRRAGVGFKRMMVFETTVTVTTDRFVVSDEAVRVLDSRE